MRDAFIVDALRTPIGKKNGKLSGFHPTDLLGTLLKGLIEKAGIDPLEVDQVIGGCVTQAGEQGSNVTRNAWIAAGLPWDVAACSVDSQCGSSMQTLQFASSSVRAGVYDLAIACGVEGMSRVPLGSNSVNPGFPFSEAFMAVCDGKLYTQFMAAQAIAKQYGFTREYMDQMALQSHQRAARATEEGRFAREMLPIKVTLADGSVEEMTVDEPIRPQTTMEKLAALPPVQEDCPDITAGNSSPISDGAAALLVASEEACKRLGLKPRAVVKHMVVAATEPIVMLKGPVPVTYKFMKKTGMKLEDIDLFECNEAMGSIAPMWQKEFGVSWDAINVNGSGISIGHPVGATGARILVTLLHELERTGKRLGFQTMCEGGGMAHVTIIERLT
jgi:acetyl-CoA acyltransferase